VRPLRDTDQHHVHNPNARHEERDCANADNEGGYDVEYAIYRSEKLSVSEYAEVFRAVLLE